MHSNRNQVFLPDRERNLRMRFGEGKGSEIMRDDDDGKHGCLVGIHEA